MRSHILKSPLTTKIKTLKFKKVKMMSLSSELKRSLYTQMKTQEEKIKEKKNSELAKVGNESSENEFFSSSTTFNFLEEQNNQESESEPKELKESRVYKFVFNEHFQKYMDELERIDESYLSEQRINVYKEIMRIASDFLEFSVRYGKIIISELYVPDQYKTIKPVDMGKKNFIFIFYFLIIFIYFLFIFYLFFIYFF